MLRKVGPIVALHYAYLINLIFDPRTTPGSKIIMSTTLYPLQIHPVGGHRVSITGIFVVSTKRTILVS